MGANAFVVVLAVVLGVVGAPRAAGATAALGPSPYLGFADSPFAGGAFSYFHLEDYEDGAFDVPGVTASTGNVLPPDALTDSVDGDDGAIDGVGAGWSWKINETTITFAFDAGVLGALPTHVGIVWTDVGFTDGPLGIGSLTFEAFDENGDPLDGIGPVVLGDGLVAGQTAEDRFFGAIHAGGISRIVLAMDSTDWEVDHLQFGRAVPEPATLTLVGIPLLLLGAARRHELRVRRT